MTKCRGESKTGVQNYRAVQNPTVNSSTFDPILCENRAADQN